MKKFLNPFFEDSSQMIVWPKYKPLVYCMTLLRLSVALLVLPSFAGSAQGNPEFPEAPAAPVAKVEAPASKQGQVPNTKPVGQKANQIKEKTLDGLKAAGEKMEPYLATREAHPGRSTVVLATFPQGPDKKSYGNLGTLVGGIFARNLGAALKTEYVVSPLEAMRAFETFSKMPEAHTFLNRLDSRYGFDDEAVKPLNKAICLQWPARCVGTTDEGELYNQPPQRYLIVRADVDFTRPYQPQSRWKQFTAWLRDDFAEEAYGYVDLEVQLFEPQLQPGRYQLVHQWHGEYPLRTDRVVGATASVYEEPTINTWGTRIAQDAFSDYWMNTLHDYGEVANFNPLPKRFLPSFDNFRGRD